MGWLVGAAAVVVAVVVLRRRRVAWLPIYVAAAFGLWLCLHEAHVHATIAGAVIGLLTPTVPHLSLDLIDSDELTDVSSVEAAAETVRLARSSVSEVEWLEHRLHPVTSFVIVPLFALANAGVSLSAGAWSDAASSRVSWAVLLGLVVGKPLGIVAVTWLLTRIGVAALPTGVSMRHVAGAGMLAGIGFTVATFIADEALAAELVDQAKIAIVVASVVSALLGATWLLRVGSKHRPKEPSRRK